MKTIGNPPLIQTPGSQSVDKLLLIDQLDLTIAVALFGRFMNITEIGMLY